METFFIPCPRGLEVPLTEELQVLGGQEIQVTQGGASCRGPFELCYRLNVQSRIGSRVLWRVGQGRYRHADDLYRLAVKLPWVEWFSVSCRIKVRLVAQHSPLQSLEFATLRIKDAICDRFLRTTQQRPVIDKRHPDIQIVVFVDQEHVVWYLDTSGNALFKRGWRKATGEAPIRENLAAGILQLARWTPEEILLDPMCGSGTFLIEAGLMGKGLAPGKGRDFAFQHLRNFEPSAWIRARSESSHPQSASAALALYGYDRHAEMLTMTRRNLRDLSLPDIQLRQIDVSHMTPPGPKGVIVTNPPYGVRMGSIGALEEWYPKFGDVLKQRFAGWRVYILTADFRLPKLIRLAPSRKIPLFNGDLESRLYEFTMIMGGNRKTARKSRQSQKELTGG